MTKQALNPELLDGKPTIAPACHHHHHRSPFLRLENGRFILLSTILFNYIHTTATRKHLRGRSELVRHCGAMDTN